MAMDDEFDKILGTLEELEMVTVNGRITETVGMLIKAIVPQVRIGEICLVKREGSLCAQKLWALRAMRSSFRRLAK